MGWFYGFKLPLVVNDRGALLTFRLTPANVDDRQPVPRMARALFGKLFGDKGYLSQALFTALLDQGVELITPVRKNRRTACCHCQTSCCCESGPSLKRSTPN